jgi:hypothetical protein
MADDDSLNGIHEDVPEIELIIKVSLQSSRFDLSAGRGEIRALGVSR